MHATHRTTRIERELDVCGNVGVENQPNIPSVTHLVPSLRLQTCRAANHLAVDEAVAEHLLIRGKKAHLGCGYFSLAPADRLGDRFAIVTGVKCFADMLQAGVVAVSVAAAACGVAEGMTGRDALLLMERA